MDDANPSPAAERELIDRSRRGDRAAFDAIVAAHRLTVYRVARRVLGSHEAADEAAQETFVRAWRSLGQFRGDARLATWLVRIALNVSRTQLAARRPEGALDAAEHLADASLSPEAAAQRAESGLRVRRAVAALPPRQKEVVVLKVFSGMTYDEVAAAMDISVGAVKAHFHQAVHNLRRHMSALGAER